MEPRQGLIAGDDGRIGVFPLGGGKIEWLSVTMLDRPVRGEGVATWTAVHPDLVDDDESESS